MRILKKMGKLLLVLSLIIGGFFVFRNQMYKNRLKDSVQPEIYDVVSITKLISGGGRLDWSADGQYIYYDAVDFDMGIVNKEPVYNIFRYNLNTQTSERVIPIENNDLPRNRGQPAISPCGNWLLFQGEYSTHEGNRIWADPGKGKFNDLWVMNLLSGELFQLTDNGGKQGVLHAHFDSTGSRIVWSHMYSEEGYTGSWQIVYADFSIENDIPTLKNILTLKPGVEPDEHKVFYETHGFSVDGKKLIFSSDLEFGAMAMCEIYTYNLESEELTKLTQSPECHDEHAIYNPAGTKIVWISNMLAQYRPGQTDLFLMDADGSNKVLLTKAPQKIIADSCWSPEGNRIAFVDLHGDSHDIYLLQFNF